MFRINKIIIKGFKSEKRIIKYNFSQNNATIVYGENGCGKTTFLKLLHAIFAQDDKTLLNEKVKLVTLEIENKKKRCTINIKLIEERFIFTEEQYNDQMKNNQLYDWNEFENAGLADISTMFLSVDRAISRSASIDPSIIMEFVLSSSTGRKFIRSSSRSIARDFSEELADYINFRSRRNHRGDFDASFNKKNLYLKGNSIAIEAVEKMIINKFNTVKINASQKIQIALFQTFAQMVKKETQEFNKLNLEYIKENLLSTFSLISNSLNEIPSNRLDNEILNLIKGSTIEDMLEKCVDNQYVCLLIKNIIENIIPENEDLNSVLILEKIFNDHIAKNKSMVIKNGEIEICLDNSGKHRVNELSSGEKQFLTLLTCILIDSSNRNIILIDEPEISLNIQWQNELVKLISEYAPDSQIIIATHSPAIVNDNAECIRELV